MKNRLIIILCLCLFLFSMPSFDADWFKIDDYVELDYDRLRYNTDKIFVWIRYDAEGLRKEYNFDIEKNVKYLEYWYVFSKNDLNYLIRNSVEYDKNGNILLEGMYPEGKDFKEIPQKSHLMDIFDIVIQGKQNVESLKAITNMGMLRYK